MQKHHVTSPYLISPVSHLELEDAPLLPGALSMAPKQPHQRLPVAVAQLQQLAVGPLAQRLHVCADGLQQQAGALTVTIDVTILGSVGIGLCQQHHPAQRQPSPAQLDFNQVATHLHVFQCHQLCKAMLEAGNVEEAQGAARTA